MASLAAICLALVALPWGVVESVRADRATLLQRLADDRLHQVDAAAEQVNDELDDVGDDLRFTTEFLRGTSSEAASVRELRALLAVVRQYRLLQLYNPRGELVLSVADPGGGERIDEDVLGPSLAVTAQRAAARPAGEIETSPRMPLDYTGWYRAFATALPAEAPGGGGSVVVLVDTEPFFSGLRIVTSDPGTRLLLLGAHGVPTPASDGILAERVAELEQERDRLPAFAGLVDRLRAGERGTLSIDAAEARRLGLPEGELIASFAPIPVQGGAHWSVATVASTAPVRERQQQTALKLGAAATALGLLLAGLGASVATSSLRARALGERLRTASALARLHEKTETILEHIPTGVLVLGEDGRITAANRALRERLPPEALGASLDLAFPAATPEVAERVRELVRAASQERRVQTGAGAELSLFGGVGQYRLHAVPLAPGDPGARLLLVLDDLTEIRALESQLLRAEKLATVGVLAAGLAHEIGTPLGVIRGRAEYVLGKLGTDHAQARGIGVIIEQIDRVTRTIRQLLDFARIRPGAARTVALAPAARAAAELLQFEADRRKVRIELVVPGELTLAADPDQLQQLLVNLLLNSCDACEGGGNVRLQAAPDPGAGAVVITVSDDGCGIPPERVHQVFDPFFTTKKRGQGTGLGLAMVAQIVGSHGARIELGSEPGRGTTVTLRWPGGAASEERHAAEG